MSSSFGEISIRASCDREDSAIAIIDTHLITLNTAAYEIFVR